jgi:hypothetical protein
MDKCLYSPTVLDIGARWKWVFSLSRHQRHRFLPKAGMPYGHLWDDSLDNMGSSTSHNLIGIHGLLRKYSFICTAVQGWCTVTRLAHDQWITGTTACTTVEIIENLFKLKANSPLKFQCRSPKSWLRRRFSFSTGRGQPESVLTELRLSFWDCFYWSPYNLNKKDFQKCLSLFVSYPR